MRTGTKYPALAGTLLAALAVFVLPSVAPAQFKFDGAVPHRTCDLVPDQETTRCLFGTLPKAKDGVAPVTYSLTFQHPDTVAPGLAFPFRLDTREFSVNGKQSIQTKDGWALRYKAVDRDGNEIIADFTVKIDGKPVVDVPPEGLNLTVGEAVDEKLITSGNGVLTLGTEVKGWNRPSDDREGGVEFTTVPGLTFGIDNTRAIATPHEAYTTISGTPTQPGEYEVTLKLTDGDGEPGAEATLNIFVNAAPGFSEARIANMVFPADQFFEIDLPELTLGNGQLEHHDFAWSTDLPSTDLPTWLELDTSSDTSNLVDLTLRGTPPAGTPTQVYTLTVTDYPVGDQTKGDFATLKFCFSVGDGESCGGVSFNGATVDPQVYTMAKRIASLTLPEAKLGTGELTYSLSCAADSTDPCDSTTGWPPGLKFDDTSRTLYGTPTESGSFTATYTVTDSAGEEGTTDTLNFGIEVKAPLTFGGGRPPELDSTVGHPVASFILPQLMGGTGTLTYSLSCAAGSPSRCHSGTGLPHGLRFKSDERKLHRTPTMAGTFALVLEAKDEAGASASLPVRVRVHPAPSFSSDSVSLRFPGPDQILPMAQGGFGPLTYSLACKNGCTGLPQGITFSTNGRTVTHNKFNTTPGNYSLTLTATDRNGVTAEKRVDLVVAGIVIKAYANQARQDANVLNASTLIHVVEGNTDRAAAPRYTLELAAKPSADVTIKLASPSGDANFRYWDDQRTSFTFTAGDFNTAGDFVGTPRTVILKAAKDENSILGMGTITHTVTSDDLDSAYHGLVFDVVLGEIDNDPHFELFVDPWQIAENAGQTTVTVTAKIYPSFTNPDHKSFSMDTVVSYGLRRRDADPSTDYTTDAPESDAEASPRFTMTIPAGESIATSTFTFTPMDDTLYEGNEYVTVEGTLLEGAITPEGWQHSNSYLSKLLTIVDDDPPPLSADCGNRPVTEGGDGRTVHVFCTVTRHDHRGNPMVADEDIVVTYNTVAGTGNRAATAGTDYKEMKDKTVTIKAGQSSAHVALAVFDDGDVEHPETFDVEFSGSPVFDTVTVTIYDDDGGPIPRPQQPQTPAEEPAPTDPDDAYRGTVAFGETAYSVTEGGPAATIAVKLDPAPPEDIAIPIPIAGKGGPGVTAEDWRFAVGEGTNDTWNAGTGTATVQFAAGETERTIALEALDDEEIEGDETLTLRFHANRLPAGVTADPEAAEAVVTLVDDDLADLRGRALEHVLAAFGRTVATDAVTLLTGRMADDAPDTGARLTLGGRTFTLRSLAGSTEGGTGTREDTAAPAVNAFDPLNPPDPRGPPVTAGQSVSLRQLLNGASFRYRHGDPEDGLLTLWGQGGTARFEGGDGTDFSLDGEATSGWLGLDWRQHGTVAGLSLAQYRGDVGYDFAGNQDAGGEVDLELTSLFPYARLSLDNGLDLWGIAGFGKGNLTLTDGFGGNSTDLSMQMAAAGLRRALTPLGSGVTLAAKADGFLVRMASEARGRDTAAFADDLPSVDAAAQRLRLALEAGYTHTLASGAVLRPTAELGARYDGGDAETGAGLDLAGGVRYQSPSRRLLVEGRGRVLLVHAATGFREWAASGLVHLTPETGGQGLSFSLQPAWGVTQTGPAALWNAALPTAGTTPRGRVTAELGYGLPAFGGRGLLTPYAGADLTQGTGRTYRAGVRSLLDATATLSLEGARRETGRGVPDTRIGLQASFVF